MSQQQQLLTVSEVAEWLHVSASLVYQLVETEKLPVFRVGNGRGAIRFQPEDIIEYLNGCRVHNRSPQPTRRLRPQLKHLRLD